MWQTRRALSRFACCAIGSVSAAGSRLARPPNRASFTHQIAPKVTYPPAEEKIPLPSPSGRPPEGSSTYTAPAPYRVFRVVKTKK